MYFYSTQIQIQYYPHVNYRNLQGNILLKRFTFNNYSVWVSPPPCPVRADGREGEGVRGLRSR
jgi:hypothetical protein